MTKNDRRVLRILRLAVEGLCYPNRLGEGWEVLFDDCRRYYGKEEALKLLALRYPADRVELIQPDDFYAPLLMPPANDGDDDDKGYALLRQVTGVLRNPVIFKIHAGHRPVQVVIAGGFPAGGTAALRTFEVTT